MSEAVDIKLLCRAGDALIAWRRHWERNYCEPPTLNCGFNLSDRRLWKLAGELMASQGIKRKLP